MPMGKIYLAAPRKRKTKKSRKKSARVKMNRTVQLRSGISKSQIVRLRYIDVIELDPVAGVPYSHVFSANSIYDPNTSGVGHQPLGHDEWQQFYSHATVLGSKIKATFLPTTNTVATGNSIVSVKLQADSVALTEFYGTLEQPETKWRTVGLSNAENGATLYHKFSAKKFFGVKNVSDADNLRGTFGGNPADQAYFHITIQGIDSAINPDPVKCVVSIEYICLLTEPKKLLQS